MVGEIGAARCLFFFFLFSGRRSRRDGGREGELEVGGGAKNPIPVANGRLGSEGRGRQDDLDRSGLKHVALLRLYCAVGL